MRKLRVVVIGAGILGSAITYRLATRGADVLLLEQGSAPGCGVTGDAFGWVNVINGTPGDRSYALWREGVDEYRRLQAELPQALADARRGSLTWRATVDETEQLADLHRRAGEDVELVKSEVLAEWEPHLRQVPQWAVFSPGDIALDPARLAATYVEAAIAAGASVRFNEKARIETKNGRVAGVLLSDAAIEADIVVLAAGGAINGLVREIGLSAGVETSPALLLRYGCSRRLVNRILRGPRLEIRQGGDGMLLVAKSYVDDGTENGPEMIGKRMLDIMREELDLPDDVALKSASIGRRPVFADGLPRLGFMPGTEGLYLAAGHPGVILAPLIGRLTAEEILDGRTAGLISSPD